MLDINTNLNRFADDVEDLGDNIESITSRAGRYSMYRAIERAVDGELQNPVLRRAQALAEKHVGSERTQTIKPVEGSWSGDTYTAGLGSNNVVVRAHAKGTGSHSSAGPYEITPNDGEQLAFEVGGNLITVDTVVHPGVRGKEFMQDAINQDLSDIMDEVLDEVTDQAERALSE